MSNETKYGSDDLLIINSKVIDERMMNAPESVRQSLREFQEKLIKTMRSSRPEYGIPGQTEFSRSFANKRAGNEGHSKPGEYGVVVDQSHRQHRQPDKK
jgi:hypothetical protein